MSTSLPREKCTILLPVRNGAAFIHKSLENLCEIAGEFDEILVINDGSTDSTQSILKEFQIIDFRIVIMDLPPSGLVTALNIGIDSASNEFIARADVDDLYSLDRINLQIELLESDPNIAAVFSDYTFWSERSLNLGCIPTAITTSATKLSLVDAFRTPHPSVIFRKSKVLSVGSYRSEDFPAEDLGLWIRLSVDFKLATVPISLLKYRINPAGITSSLSVEMKLKRDELLKSLNYASLISANINSYKSYKRACANNSFRNERLALHNLDLCLCIIREELNAITKAVLLLRISFRLLNPKVLNSLRSLISERRHRK